MAPAATSAIPAVRTMEEEALAPDKPAARAKGTVRPSETPMIMSRTISPAVKCFSLWWWMRGSWFLVRSRSAIFGTFAVLLTCFHCVWNRILKENKKNKMEVGKRLQKSLCPLFFKTILYSFYHFLLNIKF